MNGFPQFPSGYGLERCGAMAGKGFKEYEASK